MELLCLENWEITLGGIQGLGSHTEELEPFSVFLPTAQSLVALALSCRLKFLESPLIPLYHHLSYSPYSS